MKEIQLSNGEIFEIVNSSVPVTHELVTSVINELETSRSVQTLAYISLNTKSCSATTAGTLAGTVNITRCPTGNVPGTVATLGATATNTGNVGNNTFVILINAARADTGAVLTSVSSSNINLAVGATSAEFTTTYTVPGVNVNVVYALQADPAYNY